MENDSLLAKRIGPSYRASASPAHLSAAIGLPDSRDQATYETTEPDAASQSYDPRRSLIAAPKTQEAGPSVTSSALASQQSASQTYLPLPGLSLATDAKDTIGHHPASSQHEEQAIDVTATSVTADQTYWTPIWLRRRFLLALLALLLCLAASLIILFVVNIVYSGFPRMVSISKYTWTYGPTAILVCVLALWRQVDYHCKLMQPWQELSGGQVDAERSMLLDYLSPMHITSLTKAFGLRHVPVAASIAGFMILKVIILLSTGLLILTPMHFTGPQSVVIDTRFNTKSFWETVPDGSYNLSVFPRPSGPYPNISTQPVHSYLKSLKEKDTLPLRGLVDNMVHQSFTPPPGLQLREVFMEVDLFEPNISCEVAELTTWTKEIEGSLKSSGDLVAQLESATCSVGSRDHTARGREMFIDTSTNNVSEPCGGACSSWTNSHFWVANCSRLDNDTSSMPLNIETPWDIRFALLVFNFTLGPSLLVPNPNPDLRSSTLVKSNPKIHQRAAVICNVDYSMHKSMLSKDITEGNVSVDHLSTMPKFENLTGMMLGQMLYTSLHEFEGGNDAGRPFNELLLNMFEGQQNMDRFLEVDTLKSSAAEVWAGLSSHFVRHNFLDPVSVEAAAVGTRVEDRLKIAGIALWLMVTGFVLMIALTLCIILTARPNVVPENIGLLSTDAATLAASWRLRRLLLLSGHIQNTSLSRLLQDYSFGTSFQDHFVIRVTDKKTPEQRLRCDVGATAWAPFAARYPVILLTLVVPISAIVVLEVLYSMSKAWAGLVDVSGSEVFASYISRYTSALVLLLIATCFSGLDFAVALFLPYSRLRSGPSPASRGIDLHTLGKVPVHALWLSLRHRDAGSSCAKIAAMIGSGLTIISSGLWTVDRNVMMSQPIEASLVNTWNLEWPNSSSTGDGGASALFNDIQHGGAVLPKSIWHDTVLPDLVDIRPWSNKPTKPALGQSPEQNYTLQLDGLRPYLDCETIADEYVSINIHPPNNTNGKRMTTVVSARPILPLECRHAGAAGNESSYDFSIKHIQREHLEKSFAMGKFLDLHLGPWEHSTVNGFDEHGLNLKYQRDNPAGCPSIGAILATVFNDTVQHDHTTAILCSQKIQKVALNVTYSGLDLQEPIINLNIPPVSTEDSAKNLTNGTAGVDTFPYRVQTYFTVISGNVTSIEYNDPTAPHPQHLDLFMEHMIGGPNGTAGKDLFGRPNREIFKKAVQDTYARYMRHVIDMRFRQPIPQDKPFDSAAMNLALVNGTAYSFTSRLQLDWASKLAIQVMLGVMTLFGTLALMTADLRGTLPRTPSSIASRMALLAGSDFCRQFEADQPLDLSTEGWLFSLGWWHTSDQQDDLVARDSSRGKTDSAKVEGRPDSRRFGIDIGTPERLGFHETKWWTVQKKFGLF